MNRFLILIFSALVLASCSKNTMSKIPSISGLKLYPADSFIIGVDTAIMKFDFADGDADIANDPKSMVYVKDSRYDTGFQAYEFPSITSTIEDPNKGLIGTVYLLPIQPTPRDSVHYHKGDTLTYEVYITDRAGNQSNHLISAPFYLRP